MPTHQCIGTTVHYVTEDDVCHAATITKGNDTDLVCELVEAETGLIREGIEQASVVRDEETLTSVADIIPNTWHYTTLCFSDTEAVA